MKEDKQNLMDLIKLSFDDLKKIDETKNKSCKSKDFQPFLEYSTWRHFEDVVTKVLKLCTVVRHYRETHLKEIHVLTLGVQGNVEHALYKGIADLKWEGENLLTASHQVISSKNSKQNALLSELFIHRKKYSAFSCCQGCHHQADFIQNLP